MKISLREDIQYIVKISRKPMMILWLVILPLIYVLSGFYSVGTEQRAVVFRFGKIIEDNVLPGMHYRLPWPVDQIQKLPATELRSVRVDYSQNARRLYLQPEMTTHGGDLIDIAFDIQYNVPKPGTYQTVTDNAEAVIEQLAFTEALYYASEHSFEELLTIGRSQFQNHLRDRLQKQSEELNLGMNIISVLIRRLDAPRSIKGAFDRVQVAPAEKNKMIQEAYSDEITRLVNARSKVNDIKVAANALAGDTREQAQGDHARFMKKYHAWQKAPELIQQREYTEALGKILANSQVKLLSAD